MLSEWIKSLFDFCNKSKSVLANDINGQAYTSRKILYHKIVFLLIPSLMLYTLPSGFSANFLDYIKDIFAIFVGFFVTVLTFAFDKLNIEQIPNSSEMDKLPADQRWDSRKIVKVKQEHNYTIRFFYTVGLIIIMSSSVLCLLIPNVLWPDLFNVNIITYQFQNSLKDISCITFMNFIVNSALIIYRFIILYAVIKVFYYTTYSVSSLLQLLISKKKMDSWK